MSKERLFHVLRAPHVSEKSTRATAESNQYAFRVAVDADKSEIKQAVESLFDVTVESVRTIKMKGKRKSFRMVAGKRPDWKKAYVRLAEGQSIDVLDSE